MKSMGFSREEGWIMRELPAGKNKYYMTAPQSVTERYVSNLLHYGRNKEFDIGSVNREVHSHDNVCVGVYFTVIVIRTTGGTEFAAGATIQQATRRALEKHGVTFR